MTVPIPYYDPTFVVSLLMHSLGEDIEWYADLTGNHTGVTTNAVLTIGGYRHQILVKPLNGPAASLVTRDPEKP